MSLTRDQLTQLFKMADINRDGSVTLNEIVLVRMSHASSLLPPGAGQLFDRIIAALRDGSDTDNDKPLTLDEFINSMKQHQV